MNKTENLALLAILVVLGADNGAAQSVPFVIPGDDATPTATDFSSLLPKPAGRDGFVQARDGHFYSGDRRLRFWGMNLCFGANFPTHEEADKVAPHLAKLGCNAVRFHHMDKEDAPAGIWKTNEDGSRELDPEQVDRLDYFLAKLHEQGIYANINLHVSRTLTEAEGYPAYSSNKWWSSSNKWITYYDADIQAVLKSYCKALLTHTNPYRKLRRADDPGIAVIEMLNENYFSRQGTALLRELPERYVRSFETKWNEWLSAKYESQTDLVAAWKMHPNEFSDGSLFEPSMWRKEIGNWNLTTNVARSYRPKFDSDPNTTAGGRIRLEPTETSQQRHFQQLARRKLSVVQDKVYVVAFRVRSDEPREFSAEVSCNTDGNWRDLGLFEILESKEGWTNYSKKFASKETTDEAYIALSIGNSDIPIEFADVRIERSAGENFPTSQRLENGNIGVPDADWSAAARGDLRQFMADIERSWVVELRRFLREEIGVKVPITASQEDYHAATTMVDSVDYIDMHVYWNHPLFPGKPFSSTDYTTGNEPVEIDPMRDRWPTHSLVARSPRRFHGLPFTLSEWNHAEPSDVNTGAVMMAAVVASLQDWDGIFFFDYEAQHGQWFKDHYQGFFEFNSQPAKLAVFSTAANIYLRGDLPPLERSAFGALNDRLSGQHCFQYKLGIDPRIDQKQELPDVNVASLATPNGSVQWNSKQKGAAHLLINTPNTRGVWGQIANHRFDVGNFQSQLDDIPHNYGTLLLTSLDNRRVEESDKLLLLAASGAENTGMKWNKSRTSVADQWGSGPTRVTLIQAALKLPVQQGMSVYALDGTGKRLAEVPTSYDDGKLSLRLRPDQKTIWYEISQ